MANEYRKLNSRDTKVSGKLVRTFPLSANTSLPNVAIADTGKLVHAIVENQKSYFEKTIAFYSQGLSEGDKLAQLAKGKVSRFVVVCRWRK
jgi:hypothetical protein